MNTGHFPQLKGQLKRHISSFYLSLEIVAVFTFSNNNHRCIITWCSFKNGRNRTEILSNYTVSVGIIVTIRAETNSWLKLNKFLIAAVIIILQLYLYSTKKHNISEERQRTIEGITVLVDKKKLKDPACQIQVSEMGYSLIFMYYHLKIRVVVLSYNDSSSGVWLHRFSCMLERGWWGKGYSVGSCNLHLHRLMPLNPTQ